jgi:hypothetical protein
MRVSTVVLVGAASLSAAYVLVLLGVEVWENIVDSSGTMWAAALWFVFALSIPASGLVAHRVAKRRGATGAALVRHIALAVLGVAWAIAALLVIAAAPL